MSGRLPAAVMREEGLKKLNGLARLAGIRLPNELLAGDIILLIFPVPLILWRDSQGAGVLFQKRPGLWERLTQHGGIYIASLPHTPKPSQSMATQLSRPQRPQGWPLRLHFLCSSLAAPQVLWPSFVLWPSGRLLSLFGAGPCHWCVRCHHANCRMGRASE